MGFSITEGIGNVLGGAKKVIFGALETATLRPSGITDMVSGVTQGVNGTVQAATGAVTLPVRAPLAAVGALTTPLAMGLLGQRGVPMGGASAMQGQPMAGPFAMMPGGSPEGAVGMQAALSPYMAPSGTPGVTG